MKIVNGTRSLAPILKGETVVTIGNFDGHHLGHRALVNRVLSAAKKNHLISVLVTFDPHPVKVLVPQSGFKQIFDLEDRAEVLGALGLDFLCVEPFSRELSEKSPDEFFDILLKLKMKELVVGHDFSFGKNRSGTLEVLKKLCTKNKVKLEIVDPLVVDGVTVSSTRIREFLEKGQIEKAKGFLSRPFYLRGVVEKGDGRGHTIGFPTANLFTRTELFPKKGVYVTMTTLKGVRYHSVTNVGDNPTFQKGNEKIPLRVETYILNFDRDIYGEVMKVEFLKRLRDEVKFNSVAELVEQIKKDVKNTEDYPWTD